MSPDPEVDTTIKLDEERTDINEVEGGR